ncbi:hypothetical protein LJ754_16415 [Arthrobacter sp. zg-Y40]|uniref:hypothetical protein n=1 Tax=Arthrobacter sp. zg-Y40 TaxID=2886939 RepID=UPI001D147ED5|nr:hypothetical protein [Arthrobacter sp. zg-Y40]MCC3280731.1 hypothetical protein [Arthrobacter sp. zg-Y40]
MRAPKKKATTSPLHVSPELSGQTADLHINLAPSAEAQLGGDGRDRPAPPAEAGLPGWQSLGKDTKPTRAHTTRQGPRERKVRW